VRIACSARSWVKCWPPCPGALCPSSTLLLHQRHSLIEHSRTSPTKHATDQSLEHRAALRDVPLPSLYSITQH
jgi:hypothetical protein